MDNECVHINSIHEKVTPSANGCEECLKMGDTWVHLADMPQLRACRLLRPVKK